MNYQKIYEHLTSKDMTSDYTEKHHIIPRCMGGTDDPENLVILSAKAHYLAHRLLCKIYPNNYKLKFAFNMMSRSSNTQGRKYTSSQYATMSKENSIALSILHSNRPRSEESRKKLSEALKGRHVSDDTRKKLSEALKGKTKPWQKGVKRPSIGGRKKGCKNTYNGTVESRKKQSETLKKKNSPSMNTQGYEILTPSGFKPFDGVAYSGLIPTLEFVLDDGRSIIVSKKHRFDTDKIASEYKVGDALSDSFVKSISESGKKQCYDILEVPDDHIYLANGIKNHNCEFVIDEQTQLIPEWNDDYSYTFTPDQYFQYYYKYVSIDIGTKDFTAILLGYYDFKQAKLFIMDEITMSGNEMTTDVIADRIKEKEKEWFQEYTPHKRIADNNNLQLVSDLTVKHGLTVLPTSKQSLDAMLNKVRMLIKDGRLVVHPRCTMLVGNLKHGVWDKQRKAFARSKTYKHYDHLASLVYMCINIDTHTNPVPSITNNHFDQYRPNGVSSNTSNVIKTLFGGK